MSEQSNITRLEVQRKIKPMIEEVIPEYLDGDIKKTALDFILHLRENKMKPAWAIHNGWKSIYKGKPIYYIRLGKEWVNNSKNVKWVVTPYLNHIKTYEEAIINEGWQNLVWDNLHYCRSCNNGCAPGASMTVLGKELTGLCYGTLYSGRFPVSFVDPGETMVYYIKRLLDIEKQAREDNAKN